jgi:hypothetical protein
MFCPQCGAEYRPGFNRCKNCNIDLVNNCRWSLSPSQALKLIIPTSSSFGRIQPLLMLSWRKARWNRLESIR